MECLLLASERTLSTLLREPLQVDQAEDSGVACSGIGRPQGQRRCSQLEDILIPWETWHKRAHTAAAFAFVKGVPCGKWQCRSQATFPRGRGRRTFGDQLGTRAGNQTSRVRTLSRAVKSPAVIWRIGSKPNVNSKVGCFRRRARKWIREIRG